MYKMPDGKMNLACTGTYMHTTDTPVIYNYINTRNSIMKEVIDKLRTSVMGKEKRRNGVNDRNGGNGGNA